MKTMRRILCLVMAIVMLSTAAIAANACTTVAVGKDASADGSTMVAHSVDGWYDERIEIVKGGTHAEGEMVDIYRDPCQDGYRAVELVGQIPQVDAQSLCVFQEHVGIAGVKQDAGAVDFQKVADGRLAQKIPVDEGVVVTENR